MKKVLLVTLISLLCFTAFASDLNTLVGETNLMIFAIESKMEKMNTALITLSKTEEVMSGNWERMFNLIAEVQNYDYYTLYWFAKPDGSYYTLEKGLTDANLKNRAYFSDLEAGYPVYGAVVTGYTSGIKSAVAAVPVYSENGETIGYIGGSKYIDDFMEFAEFLTDSGLDKSLYVITPEGEEIFSYNIDEQVISELNPLMLQSDFGLYPIEEDESLDYQYIYGPSANTGWIYAIGSTD